MQSALRSGFESNNGEIQFWFFDADRVANFIGPIAFLEPLPNDEWVLQTSTGKRFRVGLSSEQIADFRHRGGTIRDAAGSGANSRSAAQSGFHKTPNGIYYWWNSNSQVKHLGPILAIEELSDKRQLFITDQGPYSIQLSQAAVTEYQRIGGNVRLQPPPSAPPIVSPLIAHARQSASKQAESAPSPKSQGRQPIMWRGVGQSVRLGKFELADPLIYLSKGEPEEPEASCIDITLPVGSTVVEPRGALGYWPEYRRISPGQRANYLTWLAGDRKSPLDDIGYAFIYFYGLERRILLEKQDINPITLEVVRLLDQYTFSGSFTGYLSRFLAYVIARTGLEKLRQEWFDQIFDGCKIQPGEDILALAMAWHVKKSMPINAKWAMRMAREHPQASRSVVVQRVPQQFEALFAKKYNAKFGSGVNLRTALRDRIVDYRQPASPSLLAIRDRLTEFAPPVPIPNVLGLQSQFVPLVKIWEECIEELKPLSRQLSKGVAVSSRAGFEALPDELKVDLEHPDKAKWDAIVAEHAANDGFVIVPIGKLAAVSGISDRKKLTPGQSESLAQTARHVGYCIEPDFRVSARPYQWDELVALFRAESTDADVPEQRYLSSSLVLELGFAVAAADGVITDQEMAGIVRFLEGRFVLDQAETKRLKQLQAVYLRQHPSLARISKRLLKSLSPEQREMLGRFLCGVAAADGVINDTTMKSLRGAYRAIGLATTQLDAVLCELKVAEPTATTDDAETSQVGSGPSQSYDVRIDLDKVGIIMAETAAVGILLGEAHASDDDDDPEIKPAQTAPATRAPETESKPAHRFDGLPERYHALVIDLLAREQWSESEYVQLVRARGLLPDDALSRINEWADDNLGDFLIQEGDPLGICRDLFTRIR